MNSIRTGLLFFAILLISKNAWSILEIRAHGDANLIQGKAAELCKTACKLPQEAPSNYPFFGWGADIIINSPGVSAGLGVRYEDIQMPSTTGAITVASRIQRTSVILNYRLINTLVHLGPIATYGVRHLNQQSIYNNEIEVIKITGGSTESYSFGLEFGLKPIPLVPLSFGLEGGYMFYSWKNAYLSTEPTTPQTVKMNGYYLKAFIGFDL